MSDTNFSNYGPTRQRELLFKALAGEPEPIPADHETLRQQAREAMDDGPFGYVAGNAGTERTTRDNLRAFDCWSIQPRVLQGIDDRSLSIEFLGEPYSTPLFLAPVGVQSIVHENGALASARAADNLGIPFVHSTVSSYTIEEIADISSDTSAWFQLYWSSDPDLNKSLIDRAHNSGYQGIIITLDTPLMGWRPRDLDQGYFPFLEGDGLANYTSDPVFLSRLEQDPKDSLDESIELFLEIFSDTSVDWSGLQSLAENIDLPVIVKGIMHPDDAVRATDCGVDGVIVSNHGGRQIDGELPALTALDPVKKTLSDSTPVLFDSGIRSGSDCFKALALGADAVLLGRPYLYGLGIDGRDGVEAVVKNVLAELDITLGLSGCESVDELTRGLLVETG